MTIFLLRLLSSATSKGKSNAISVQENLAFVSLPPPSHFPIFTITEKSLIRFSVAYYNHYGSNCWADLRSLMFYHKEDLKSSYKHDLINSHNNTLI